MPDDLENGTGSVVAAAADDGISRPKASGLDSFKSSAANGESSSPGRPASSGPGGKKKSKVGRPPKNVAGISKADIDEAVADPEVEAARVEFEELLVSLLVATTDNFADERFELLKNAMPHAVAKGLADKLRLLPKEREFFGKVAIRLWRKYLGDKYLFSDEGIAAAYAVAYMLRNIEGYRLAKKIGDEINGKKPAEQPPIPSAAHPDSRDNGNGKDDAGNAHRGLTPSAVSPGL